jgi:hypothetical protein
MNGPVVKVVMLYMIRRCCVKVKIVQGHYVRGETGMAVGSAQGKDGLSSRNKGSRFGAPFGRRKREKESRWRVAGGIHIISSYLREGDALLMERAILQLARGLFPKPH